MALGASINNINTHRGGIFKMFKCLVIVYSFRFFEFPVQVKNKYLLCCWGGVHKCKQGLWMPLCIFFFWQNVSWNEHRKSFELFGDFSSCLLTILFLFYKVCVTFISSWFKCMLYVQSILPKSKEIRWCFWIERTYGQMHFHYMYAKLFE